MFNQRKKRPLRTVVIDDESSGREALKALLRACCPGVQVVGEAASIKTAFTEIENIDLVFLDIQLPDGNGFDFLEKVSERSFEVIFVTAYDQYGIRAVKASAADYLLKPVCAEELCTAVERAIERYHLREAFMNGNPLHPNHFPQRLILPNAEELVIVNIPDILRCQSHSNYTTFHIADGRSILVSRSMSEYEKILTCEGFFRVHNSHMINMQHIRSYVRGKGGYVIMVDGSEVDVSVRRKEGFLRALKM